MKEPVIALLALLLAVCGHAKEIPKDYDPLAGIAKLEPFPDDAEIRRRIQGADSVTVFEGLPHSSWEPAALRREATRKDVFWIQEIGFYERPLLVQKGDLDEVVRIALDASAFAPHDAPHLCGEFHPDYCVSWRKQDAFVQALICLGCGEVIFLTNEGYSYVDLQKEAYAKLKDSLGKYRVNRPVPNEEDEKLIPPPSWPAA